MKILLVHAQFVEPLGGAEAYVLKLATSLAARGNDVAVAAGHIDRALKAETAVRWVRAFAPNLYRGGHSRRAVPLRGAWHTVDTLNFVAALSVRQILARFRPDIVHSHNFQGLGGPTLSALTRSGVPHIHTVHDYSLIDPSTTLLRQDGTLRTELPIARRLRARWLQSGLRDALTVFPSESTYNLHKALGWNAPSVVIPHGWEFAVADGLTPANRSQGARFLYLGMLSNAKGIPELMAAWREFDPHVGEAELVIAGRGPLEHDVRNFVQEVETATYVGWVDGGEKRALLRSASMALLISRWTEVFPLAVAEALLAGVPLLVSEVCTPPPVVDGYNGLIVRNGIDEWARLFRRVAHDASLAHRLADGAAKTGPSLDWSMHVNRIEELYSDRSASGK